MAVVVNTVIQQEWIDEGESQCTNKNKWEIEQRRTRGRSKWWRRRSKDQEKKTKKGNKWKKRNEEKRGEGKDENGKEDDEDKVETKYKEATNLVVDQ